ncbi:MAG TPA: hypothetical protein VFW05_15535 [Verrucomicrobiae bacterium]|nr:hypothetical protein [Verrucomicrobiae bacterium]
MKFDVCDESKKSDLRWIRKLAVCGLLLLLAGCGHSGDQSTAPWIQPFDTDRIDIHRVAEAFKSADSGTQVFLQESIASVRAGNYAEAAGKIEKFTQHASLNTEQRDALTEFENQLKAAGGGSK